MKVVAIDDAVHQKLVDIAEKTGFKISGMVNGVLKIWVNKVHPKTNEEIMADMAINND